MLNKIGVNSVLQQFELFIPINFPTSLKVKSIYLISPGIASSLIFILGIKRVLKFSKVTKKIRTFTYRE